MYEAADALGVTVDAIRKRVQRGTIPHERDDSGRIWVLLDVSSTLRDDDQDATRTAPDDRDERIDELKDQVGFLRRELEGRTEELRRRDVIISQLVQRVPELESPQEPRGSSESAAEGPGEGEGPTEPSDQETELQRQLEQERRRADQEHELRRRKEEELEARLPWWRRWFGR